MKRLWINVVCCLVLLSGRPAWADEKNGELLSVQEIVEITLGNNPALEEAEANIGAAEASVKSSLAEMLPEAGFSYGYTRLMEAPIMKVGGVDMQTAHQRIYNWDVTVVQPLFTGYALSSKLDISKLDVEARKLEKVRVAQDLTKGVKSACYGLILARKLMGVGEDEVASLEAHQRNAEMFFEQGLIRKNDLLQAEVALANSRQQLENDRADVRKAEMALNRLMNRSMELPVYIEDAGAQVDTGHDFDAIALGELALENRPIMQLLDVGLEQLGLTEKMAKSAWYPTLALVGQYERSGDDPFGNNNDYSNEYNASITAQLQWKFWIGGKTRADVENVRLKTRSLEASIDRYRQQVLEEVRSAVIDCEVARGNIETAVAALDQARENWRITDLQYREQTALASDVLDARTFLSMADANYYRSVYGYLDAVAALERAVGQK